MKLTKYEIEVIYNHIFCQVLYVQHRSRIPSRIVLYGPRKHLINYSTSMIYAPKLNLAFFKYASFIINDSLKCCFFLISKQKKVYSQRLSNSLKCIFVRWLGIFLKFLQPTHPQTIQTLLCAKSTDIH